ncbi:DedA family protein [Phytohabitans rumicis]|uniref:DedA family protein n=1 Tax=Phytohabitans rumicis TaxID=1076125 RepID=UPI0031EDD87D
MQWLNDLLGGLPPVLVYAVVGALVAGEVAVTAGLVLPAATALIALGLLANAGTVDIAPSLGVAVGAAWLGGTLAYRSGRRLGSRARTTRFGRWIGPRRWERADRLFTRYGGRALFLGQWVVVARTLVPRLAGMNGVPYRRFAAWHTPAAVLWAVWLVGASYGLGASYDRVASRLGHASGALAVLVGMIVVLVLAGRWIGRHPDPIRASGALLGRLPLVRAVAGRDAPAWSWRGRLERRYPLLGPAFDVALSVALLSALAALLVVATPVIVRFSGLDAVDASVAAWARSEWASDTYLFALSAATSVAPEGVIGAAAVVSIARWCWVWWRGGHRLRRDDAVGILAALGPVLPVVLLAAVLEALIPPVSTARGLAPDGWRAPESIVLPPVAEFDGQLPPADAAGALAGLAAGETALLAAAVGLLTWLLTRRAPRPLRVAAWTAAIGYVVVCGGGWVFIGWSRTSETVAALLLGAAWTAFNAAIWSARRTGGRGTEPPASIEYDLRPWETIGAQSGR